MIEWTKAQTALTRAGDPCGKIDGAPGKLTYGALFAFAAGKVSEASIESPKITVERGFMPFASKACHTAMTSRVIPSQLARGASV